MLETSAEKGVEGGIRIEQALSRIGHRIAVMSGLLPDFAGREEKRKHILLVENARDPCRKPEHFSPVFSHMLRLRIACLELYAIS